MGWLFTGRVAQQIRQRAKVLTFATGVVRKLSVAALHESCVCTVKLLLKSAKLHSHSFRG